MNDVFRRHRQFHRLPHRHMEFVDLSLSLSMLGFPHPLPSDDADLESVVGWIINVKINDRAPDKHDHCQTEWDGGPKNFEPEVSLNGSRPFILRATAVFNREHDNHEKNQCSKEDRHRDEKIKERIDPCRHGRCLFREQRETKIHGLKFSNRAVVYGFDPARS